MNKKWMILVFTLVLALLLAACGSDVTQEQVQEVVEKVEEVAPTIEAAVEEAAHRLAETVEPRPADRGHVDALRRPVGVAQALVDLAAPEMRWGQLDQVAR